MSDRERYLALIGDCLARWSYLGEPERRFIEAIEQRLRAGGMPSPQQVRTLYDVWDGVALEAA